MVTNCKVGVACWQYIPRTLGCDTAMDRGKGLKERLPCVGKFGEYRNSVSTCRQESDDADMVKISENLLTMTQ